MTGMIVLTVYQQPGAELNGLPSINSRQSVDFRGLVFSHTCTFPAITSEILAVLRINGSVRLFGQSAHDE